MSKAGHAIRGGGFVAANHVVSALISLLVSIAYSKFIGPSAFAIIAVCGSLSLVARIVCRLGINAYLLTRPQNPSDREYDIAFTGMLISSLITSIFVIFSLAWLERVGHFSKLFLPGVVTMGLLPLHVIGLPANTRLERGLRFKGLMTIEFVAQLLSSGVAVGGLLLGSGIWGIIASWVIRAVFLALAPWVLLHTIPRFAWNTHDAWRMFKYGFNYLISSSLEQLRNLVVLFIIGRLLGQEVVGHFELSLRSIRLLGPFRAAAARVGIPALAPLANSPSALKKTVIAIVETELILGIPVTIIAALVYPIIVNWILGPAWRPSISMFPWVAGASLFAALHANTLTVLHIKACFKEAIASSIIIILSQALLLVLLAKVAGPTGCAAIGVVSWPAFWFREWIASKRSGTQWSRPGAAWAIGGASACFANQGGFLLLIPLFVCSLITLPIIRKRALSLFGAKTHTID